MDEVGAKVPKKEDKNETPIVEIDVHVGVFFDGTSNNANTNKWYDYMKHTYFVEKSQALENRVVLDKYKKNSNPDKKNSNPDKNNSNPAILSKLFISSEKDTSHIGEKNEKYLHVYIEGSGANGFQSENKYLDLLRHGKAVKGLGFGVGKTGVVAKVSKAVRYVSDKIQSEDNNHFTKIRSIHFYVFGFSRGSAAARLFSFLVARSNGDVVPVLPREKEFDQYLSFRHFKNGKVSFLENHKGHMTVDFLGIYDTVSAIGFLKDKDGSVNGLRYLFMGDKDFWGENFHKNNSEQYGLYSPSLDSVKSTCHICAIDEYRANFAVTDIGLKMPDDSIELFVPGCHSDVGGGYLPTPKEETKTIKKMIGGMITRMKNNGVWNVVSKETLMQMGWGNDSELKEDKEKIDIDHMPAPDEVYSNITLRLMLERAKAKAPKLNQLFSNLEDAYPEPKEANEKNTVLNRMSKELHETILKDGRFYYTKFTPEEYSWVRMHYLHFTASDTMHTAGDLGNVPGRDGSSAYSDIKRLLYHGGQGDGDEVHYLHDIV